MEIGQLAKTSAEAVHNIEKLIGEIHLLVGDTIRQTGESVKNINQSSKSVGDALKTFDTIFNNIEETNGLIQEMLLKVGQVDDVATNVAAISQEQAASSQEILATSETMVEQADQITEIMKYRSLSDKLFRGVYLLIIRIHHDPGRSCCKTRVFLRTPLKRRSRVIPALIP